MTTYNNRLLFFILIGLIGIFVLAKLFRAPKREGNLKFSLIQVDTASVSEIRLYPASGQREEIRLQRQGGKWLVKNNTMQSEADNGSANSLLHSIVHIQAERIMSRSKDKWDTYKVGDTTGTRVLVFAGGDQPVAEWWIGEAPSQGGVSGGGLSYVRLPGDNEVYAVGGYLNPQFDKAFNDWRNKTFLRLAKEQISSIHATGAAGFSLQKKDAVWTVDEQKADSTLVTRYLNKIYSKNLNDFADNFTASSDPDAVLTIGMDDGKAAVSAWKQDSTWVVSSSQRRGVFFRVRDNVLKEEIWTDPKDLVAKEP